ncbi:probable serine/threonine-protein kinase MARK-A isoform X3 [Tachysurus ichikawai]
MTSREKLKMGDDLASRKLTFATHICYVVAEVELGSRRQFELIGCDRLPYGMLALFEPFLRTETYEYVLWLTSGKAQPSFQIFKYLLASRMAYLYAPERAIKYCELSCKLQNEDAEEPEWLLELKQLHRTKLANANVSDDPEQYMTSTSQTFRASEIQQSEGCLLNENISELQCPDSEQYADLEALLSLRYQLGELLRSGHFGFVYKAIWDVVAQWLSLDVFCSNIVELLEWFDMGSQFVMILERPSPCMDLMEFQKLQKGFLSESQARDIMVQVIQAARHCCDHGVFHCDISAENLIINPDTLEVKLIDFGCGELLKDTTYKYYYGTMYFAPPEWLGEIPFEGLLSLNYGYLKVPPDLSPDCFHLIMWCLDVNPETRPTFEHLHRHEWFTGTVQDNVQVRQ